MELLVKGGKDRERKNEREERPNGNFRVWLRVNATSYRPNFVDTLLCSSKEEMIISSSIQSFLNPILISYSEQ